MRLTILTADKEGIQGVAGGLFVPTLRVVAVAFLQPQIS